MRSIWKGTIAFGLVNVPVKVYSATEDHDIKFHQVHAKDNGRIRYKRVCEVDGEVVEAFPPGASAPSTVRDLDTATWKLEVPEGLRVTVEELVPSTPAR